MFLLGVLYNTNLNKYFKIMFLALILILYLTLPFDYGLRIPFITISLYYIEKLCQKDTFKDKLKYLSLILVVFLFSLVKLKYGIALKYSMLFSLLFIALYNGEKGSNNKFVKYSFYAFFPIHHVILYLIAMFL